MIKHAFNSIRIIWANAKIPMLVKILQCILTAILTPLTIYFTQHLIDGIELYARNRTNVRYIVLYMSLLILSLLFVAGNGFLDNIIDIFLKRSVNRSLTSVVVDKFRKIEYACFEDKETADTINRMGKSPHEKILNIFLTTINIITLLITIFGTIIIFAQVSLWFPIAFICVLIPILWLDFKAMDMMNSMFNSQSKQERHLAYLSGLLNEKTSLFELKIFNAVDYILSKYRKTNKDVLDERVRTTIRSQKYFAVSTLLIIFWAGFVVFSLIWSVYQGAVSIGAFIALMESAGTVLGLSESLSGNFSRLSQNYLEIKHYYKFLALPEMDDNIKNPCDFGSGQDIHIIFDDVYFAYPKTDKQVLKGASFEIRPHQRVALVGENGAGKSTIVKLLCKLYKADKGRILVNGININDIPSSRLKEIYSVVFQDYASYSLTVRENVAFGDIGKLRDNKAVLAAMEEGMAAGILPDMPNGIDTNLGRIEKDGIDLSGGQWQRIAIARACMADNSLVILDEPTASLDPVAESEMYTAFSKVLKSRGCIMISHRLASARLADTIIVLQEGSVAECGSHSELMSKEGLYSTMFTAQSSWYHMQETEVDGCE